MALDITSEIPFFNVEFDPDFIKTDAIKLIKQFRPNWREDSIKIKVFTNGITNRLFGCYVDSDLDNMILIRIYGNHTELFIDRTKEIRNIKLMNENGLSPPLFATFKNGICYGYNKGTVIDEKMVRDDKISHAIAKMVAKVHSIKPNPSIGEQQPCLFGTMRKYLQLLASLGETDNLPTIKELEEEINVCECLIEAASTIVFCHNDLLLNNIIYNEKDDQVSFIDFEYADFNYQAYDIGNHFCEFTGVGNYDPSKYPCKAFQLKWLKIYLTYFYEYSSKSNNDIKDEELEAFYQQVRKFSMIAHLFWALWSFIQSKHSSIDFDFIGYGMYRIKEYQAFKNNIIK